MITLFYIGNIEIRISTIIAFLLGIVVGIIIFSLAYVILVLSSLSDKKYRVKIEGEGLSETEAKEMILKCQKAFKDKELRGSLTKGQYFKKLVYEMVYGIAASFFPNSKYPLFELSVDEGIELVGYVNKRLDEIFDKRGIRRMKSFKFSTIYNVSKRSIDISNSNSFKAAKKATKAASKVKRVLDIINPVNYLILGFKKVTIGTLTNKLYLVLIGIIGEEAYKVYSKSVLNKEVEIDSGVDDLLDSIKDDFEEEKSNDDYKSTLKYKAKPYILEKSKQYKKVFNRDLKCKSRIGVQDGQEG